jgi:hypothetical protein
MTGHHLWGDNELKTLVILPPKVEPSLSPPAKGGSSSSAITADGQTYMSKRK